jgi:hypothetical protein
MSQHGYSELYAAYPDTIAVMPREFKSHDFIKRLSESNQAAYVDALSAYKSNGRPFLTVHARLAQHLHSFPTLVAAQGQVDSEDIFGNSNRCGLWTRLA